MASTNQRGFTLIELLVVVAVIAILTAIAIPSWDTYRKRSYEAVAIQYLRSWPPAQEAYLLKYGYYADADETLAQDGLGINFVPTNVPYNFSIDSTTAETSKWWGRASPTKSGLRYFCINQTGVVQSQMGGAPDCSN